MAIVCSNGFRRTRYRKRCALWCLREYAGEMTARKLIRRITFLLVYHLYTRHKLSRRSSVVFSGLKLEIPPSVFHPKLFFSTRILADYLFQLTLKGKRVLEMGCGSGALSLVVASCGAAKVTALDINPNAVDCTRTNALANGFADRVEVFQSNLFSALQPGLLYDYIIWNPPFFPYTPSDIPNHAWNAGENYRTLQEFAERASAFLSQEGVIILILSSDMNIPQLLRFFSAEQLDVRLASSTKRFFEVFSIYEFRAAPSARLPFV